MRYVVIMAGGLGTRLWPLSSKGRPKQLLEIIEGKSLLRLAYERLRGLVPDQRILVCTGRVHAADVAEQLPELDEENILGEPEGRDSLNAVAWSAAVLAHRDPDAVVAMVTADHVINPVGTFQHALDKAFAAAEEQQNALVTLGVVPNNPHTGYGYLRRGEKLAPGMYRVAEFKEKPTLEIARSYLESGEYWWNSGMFVWRAATLLGQLDVLLPETAAVVRRLADHPELLDELFPTLVKNSVDYAIMEPASQGKTGAQVLSVELAVEWRDVGGYLNYAELLTRDDQGNSIAGATVLLNSSGCIVINTIGPRHVVAGLGLERKLVVATPRATLVADLDDAERIKQLVAQVADRYGAELA